MITDEVRVELGTEVHGARSVWRKLHGVEDGYVPLSLMYRPVKYRESEIKIERDTTNS